MRLWQATVASASILLLRDKNWFGSNSTLVASRPYHWFYKQVCNHSSSFRTNMSQDLPTAKCHLAQAITSSISSADEFIDHIYLSYRTVNPSRLSTRPTRLIKPMEFDTIPELKDLCSLFCKGTGHLSNFWPVNERLAVGVAHVVLGAMSRNVFVQAKCVVLADSHTIKIDIAAAILPKYCEIYV